MRLTSLIAADWEPDALDANCWITTTAEDKSDAKFIRTNQKKAVRHVDVLCLV